LDAQAVFSGRFEKGEASVSRERRRGGVRAAAGCLVLLLVAGCGAQNPYLGEGKDLLKSDKRRRVELAVEQFRLALTETSSPPLTSREEAETHYLLGYYDDISVEERAEHFVRAAGLHARKYEDALIYEALRDRDESVRAAVRMALVRRYQDNRTRIRKELLKALHGKDNRNRYDAAWVLGSLAARDDALVNEIIRALDHRQMQTRLSAVIALEELARHDRQRALQAREVLLQKVEGRPRRTWWRFWSAEGEREHPEVRTLAVAVLGKVGATEELLGILSNKGSSLRANAMQALIESGGSESAVPVLLGLLREGSADAAPWTTTHSEGRRMVRLRPAGTP
jgi:tetratricopeptide (TPR) repeat protein